MVQRCTKPGNTNYPYYGGRGITVAPEWMTLDGFLASVPPRPSLKHTLDRIDNNGPYAPGNVRWATRFEQAQNRRTTKRYPCDGAQLTPSEILVHFVSTVGLTTVVSRLERGWDAERAAREPTHTVFRPKKRRGRRRAA